MPQKRMFSLAVVDTDAFLDMPVSAQALYFHLGMHSDDDGFISNPKRISRAVGCNNDDIKILIQKGFIIPFESGVVVIRDWKINNTLRNDRYKPTLYTNELGRLKLDASGRYIFTGIQNGNQMDTKWIPNGNQMEPQPNVTQINVDKRSVNIGGETAENPPPAPASCDYPHLENRNVVNPSLDYKPQLNINQSKTKESNTEREKRKRFTPPTLEEVSAYCRELNSKIDPQQFIDYYTANGWVQGKGKPIKDWKATVRTWNRRENKPQNKAAGEVNARIFEELFGGEPT